MGRRGRWEELSATEREHLDWLSEMSWLELISLSWQFKILVVWFHWAALGKIRVNTGNGSYLRMLLVIDDSCLNPWLLETDSMGHGDEPEGYMFESVQIERSFVEGGRVVVGNHQGSFRCWLGSSDRITERPSWMVESILDEELAGKVKSGSEAKATAEQNRTVVVAETRIA